MRRDVVPELVDVAAVLGRHAKHLRHPELPELGCVVVMGGAVTLVHHEQHAFEILGTAESLAKNLCSESVCGREPCGTVDYEQDDVRLLHGGLGLRPDRAEHVAFLELCEIWLEGRCRRRHTLSDRNARCRSAGHG